MFFNHQQIWKRECIQQNLWVGVHVSHLFIAMLIKCYNFSSKYRTQ